MSNEKNYNESNLFNNPMIDEAKKAMSKKDIERYEKIGEEIWKNIDFVNNDVITEGNIINTVTPEMKEGINQIIAQINSGLHPSMLEDNEKIFMADALGKEWYLKWGYLKEDLDNIITYK
ncbi:MAG: hypothetical protein CBD97_02005 [Pelagibacteraceae bacterium TMED237]|nr:MAG: hypothetical protein CBD97_02005 [Pelagibacteraceae bacterium TMED237]|tara:strand:+ start:2389 stop:2748 length:360 start_codon:yes stop_codon:yes gene_type:complete